jgi:ABC-type lipoprotein release transport system permease subunit
MSEAADMADLPGGARGLLRMALGARPWGLMRMMLGQGVRLCLLGAAIGLVCAAGLTQLLGSLLYELGGLGPDHLRGASYLPARGAAAADPMRSLRAE